MNKAVEIKKFESQVKAYEDTITKLVGNKYGITADEFAMSVMTAVKKTPKLLNCDRGSLFAAVLLSAELKLPFNTPSGFSYIIPYGNEAQFQVGYKGLVEIAYRNPRVKSVYAGVVYADEVAAGLFRYSRGMDVILEHTPIMNRTPEQEREKEVYCTYGIVKLEGADPIIEVLDANQLNAIKKISKGAGSQSSPAAAAVSPASPQPPSPPAHTSTHTKPARSRDSPPGPSVDGPSSIASGSLTTCPRRTASTPAPSLG